MGVLAEFFLSLPSEAATYDGDGPERGLPLLQSSNITEVELSTLWALLEGRAWDAALLERFTEVRSEDDGERVTVSVPEAFVNLLAQTPEADLRNVVRLWAQTDEIQADPEEVAPFVEKLQAFCRQSIESGTPMFLWNCL